MADLLARLDRAALSLIRKDFQRAGDRLSIAEFSSSILHRLSADIAAAVAIVDLFDSLPDSSVTWSDFLDFLTPHPSSTPSGSAATQERKFALEEASHLLSDTTRHTGRIQTVRAKLGVDFHVLASEDGLPGIRVFRKTADQGVVIVPGERIVPDILLALPDEFGSSGEYCRDFVCTEMVYSGTFSGELVAATINRRAVVVWEHGGGYKTQCRGVVPLADGGDRIWWSPKLKLFLVSVPGYEVLLLDPVNMNTFGKLPMSFRSRVVGISDVRSIAGADFISVVEETGTSSLLALSRDNVRDITPSVVMEVGRKVRTCLMHKSLWYQGCLDGTVVVSDPVNSLIVRVLLEHKTSITCLEIMNDQLVTREDRGDIILWELTGFTPLHKLSAVSHGVCNLVALDSNLLLAASDTRFFFYQHASAKMTGIKPRNDIEIRCVLFDFRQHRLLVVSTESVISFDLATHADACILRSAGIATAALESSACRQLAVATSAAVKVVNLCSGLISYEITLLEHREVSAISFLSAGKKLAVLTAGGWLLLFVGVQRVASLAVPQGLSELLPLSVDANSSRILLWGIGSRAVIVQEAARIGKSDLVVDFELPSLNFLAATPRSGSRLGEADGLVFVFSNKLAVLDSRGEFAAQREFPGLLATHVVHLSESACLGAVEKSILAKFEDSVSYANKKIGRSKTPISISDLPAAALPSSHDRCILIGEASTGTVRVFEAADLSERTSLSIEAGFFSLAGLPGQDCMVVTTRSQRVQIWSIARREIVFDACLTPNVQVKVNAMNSLNPLKKELALFLGRLSGQVLGDSSLAAGFRMLPDVPETETAALYLDRSLSRSSTRPRSKKKLAAEITCPVTPRTLSQPFLKELMLRSPDPEKQSTLPTHLEEELDNVEELFMTKKENVVVEQKKKEFNLSTKLAYSLSGSVYRKMNDSKNIADFVEEYSRSLARQATPSASSRLSTAPTRTATAKKPRSN